MGNFFHASGRVLFVLYEFVAMLLGLGMLALLCLVWAPFALLLSWVLPARAGRFVGRYVIMWSFRFYLRFLAVFCYCRFDLDELDALRGDQPLIIVANHPSLLDAVIVLSRFPNMVCMMKAALMRNALFGAAARLAGYICNDAALDSILRSREELQAGAQLLLFPEGTRTTRFPVNACSGSVGLIAGRVTLGVGWLALPLDGLWPALGLWLGLTMLYRYAMAHAKRVAWKAAIRSWYAACGVE